VRAEYGLVVSPIGQARCIIYQAHAQVRLLPQAPEGSAQCSDITMIDEQTCLTVGYRFRNTANPRGNDRPSLGERFDHCPAEGLTA
jgi:hypothetical protein